MFINENQVRDILNQTAVKMGVSTDTVNRIKIKYSCATRFFGQAERQPKGFGPNGVVYDLTIKLSKPLMEVVSEDETKNTIIHEFCHILDGEINGKMDGHGYGWRYLMKLAGIDNPKACGPRVDMVDISGMVKVACSCGTHSITKNRATRMKKGYNYRCIKCKCPISIVK